MFSERLQQGGRQTDVLEHALQFGRELAPTVILHVCSTRGEVGVMGAKQHTHHRETERQTDRQTDAYMIRLANTYTQTHRCTDEY